MTLRFGLGLPMGGSGSAAVGRSLLHNIDGRGTYGPGSAETVKADCMPSGLAAADRYAGVGAWNVPAGSLVRENAIYRGAFALKMRSCARGFSVYAPLDAQRASSDPAFRYSAERLRVWATFAMARKDGAPISDPGKTDPANDVGILLQGTSGIASLTSTSFPFGGGGNGEGIFFGMGPLGQWLYFARSLTTTELVNAGPSNGARVGVWEDFTTVACDVWRANGKRAGRIRFSVNGRKMIERSYDDGGTAAGALPKRDPAVSPNGVMFYPWLVNKSLTHDMYLAEMGTAYGPDSDAF